jgi:endonuclease YncB( thermonuclease family)
VPFLRNLIFSLHLLLGLAGGIGEAAAGIITGKVVKVSDGDTVTVLAAGNLQVKVRLAGIDAPENGQEFGEKSRQALAAMVAGKVVTVSTDGTDRYGRTIGWIRAGETDANREMVRQGWAWHFTHYNRDPGIAQLQVEAKAARRGLWAAPNLPMAPWDFRALKRGGTAIEKPASEKSPAVDGKYWINSNGVRHNAGCRWFGNTKRGHYGDKDEGEACGQCGG